MTDTTPMDVPPTTHERLTDATAKLQQAYHHRLARELVAAWMAGFQGLAVYRGMDTADSIDDSLFPTIRVSFVPTDVDQDRLTPGTTHTVDYYDLTEMDRLRATVLRRRHF